MTYQVKLLPYGTPSLTKPSKMCPERRIPRLREELAWIYTHEYCAGMAAPQFGKNYRCFVARGQIFINVEQVELIGTLYQTTEGCFSCAGWHTVRRYPEVNLKTGKEVTHYTGYIAQVIQHEYDHIEGILINRKGR